jgi:hypothetical protein
MIICFQYRDCYEAALRYGLVKLPETSALIEAKRNEVKAREGLGWAGLSRDGWSRCESVRRRD